MSNKTKNQKQPNSEVYTYQLIYNLTNFSKKLVRVRGNEKAQYVQSFHRNYNAGTLISIVTIFLVFYIYQKRKYENEDFDGQIRELKLTLTSSTKALE